MIYKKYVEKYFFKQWLPFKNMYSNNYGNKTK